MKRFMYLSIGVLCLAVAALIFNNLSTREVQAQAGQTIVGYSCDWSLRHFVMTANGDVYVNDAAGPATSPDCRNQAWGSFNCSPVYIGNFWTGTPPVLTAPGTWSTIKGLYDAKK